MNLHVKKYFLFFIVCITSLNLCGQSVGGTPSSGGTTYCDSINGGIISLTGFNGTSYYWESSTDGITWNATGTSWMGTMGPPFIFPPPNGQSFYNLTQTTCYRAIVQDGAFPPDTSTVSCIIVYLPSVGGTISGGGTFCVSSGSGTLNLSGNTGGVLNWQLSTDNGSSWTGISNTTTSLNYTSITQNTLYSAVVQNGSMCPTDTSSTANFNIDFMTNAGTISGSDTFCYGINSGSLNLSGILGSVLNWISSSDSGLTWNTIPNATAIETYSNLVSTAIYAAIVKNATCPADTSAFAEIFIRTLPSVDAGTDTTIIAGQSVNLNGSGGGIPLWIPSASLSSSTVFNPVATPLSTTSFTLNITDNYGCVNTDTVVITVLPPVFDGMVSNLFTPNGDGINDTWYIQGIDNFPDSEVHVFNIYGNEVYLKNGYTNDWKGTYNGSALPDGTYYYILKFGDSKTIIKGSIDILSSR